MELDLVSKQHIDKDVEVTDLGKVMEEHRQVGAEYLAKRREKWEQHSERATLAIEANKDKLRDIRTQYEAEQFCEFGEIDTKRGTLMTYTEHS